MNTDDDLTCNEGCYSFAADEFYDEVQRNEDDFRWIPFQTFPQLSSDVDVIELNPDELDTLRNWIRENGYGAIYLHRLVDEALRD